MSVFPVRRRTVLQAVAAGAVGFPAPASTAPAMDTLELQIRVAGWSETPLSLNGVFDSATRTALRLFQQGYLLRVDGIAGPSTIERLASLAKPDGSTNGFEWGWFASPDGSGFGGGKADEAVVRENVRRLMYRLEALRHKLDGRAIEVVNGFRSAERQARLRGSSHSSHLTGGAADIVVPGMTTFAVHRVARTCGFPDLGPPTQSWLHCG